MDATRHLRSLAAFLQREHLSPADVPGDSAAAKGLRLLLEAAASHGTSVFDRVRQEIDMRSHEGIGVTEALRQANAAEHGSPGRLHQQRHNEADRGC